MNNALKIAAVAVLGLGTMVLTATTASAAVICNGEGECWHSRHAYHYQSDWGITVHPNSWKWGPGDHYVWREHKGRGYWHSGAWVTF
jgi:hypothetical protein